MVDKQNPLQVPQHVSIISNINKNKRGRPLKKKTILYSEQPKSIISQLLSKMRQDNIVTIPINTQKPVLDENIDSKDSDVEENEINESNDVQEMCVDETEKDSLPKVYCCDYPDCKYSSKHSSNITKHKRTHTSEKPYLCDRCSFRTSFVNSLKSHRRLHSEERPYHCQHCTYKCNSISNLKKHSYTKHKDK